MNKQFYLYRDSITNKIFARTFARIKTPIVVKRAQEPYWQQRGWKQYGSKKSGSKYYGFYKVGLKEFEGKAEVSPFGRTKLYIKEIPKELEHHEHYPCFMKESNGWYFIHNNDNGNFDLSSGILQVEQILTEAFNS